MAFALSGTTITQTGTDANLSGLSNITGVVKSGNHYAITGGKLKINGTLTGDDFEELTLISCKLERPSGGKLIMKPFFRINHFGTAQGADQADNTFRGGFTFEAKTYVIGDTIVRPIWMSDRSARCDNFSAFIETTRPTWKIDGLTVILNNQISMKMYADANSYFKNMHFKVIDATITNIMPQIRGADVNVVYEDFIFEGMNGFSAYQAGTNSSIKLVRPVFVFANDYSINTAYESGKELQIVDLKNGGAGKFNGTIVNKWASTVVKEYTTAKIKYVNGVTPVTDVKTDFSSTDTTNAPKISSTTAATGVSEVELLKRIKLKTQGTALNSSVTAPIIKWQAKADSYNNNILPSSQIFAETERPSSYDTTIQVSADSYLTETTKATVDAYIANDTANNFYDRVQSELVKNLSLPTDLLSVNGKEITLKTGWSLFYVPVYDETKTYNTGNYVKQNNLLYKCKSDNVTGVFNVTNWTGIDTLSFILIDKTYKNIFTECKLKATNKFASFGGSIDSSFDGITTLNYVKSNGKVNLNIDNINPNNFAHVTGSGAGIAVRKTSASALVNGALTKGATTVTIDSVATGVSHADLLNKFIYIDNFTYYVTATTATSLTLQTGVIKDIADNKEIFVWETKQLTAAESAISIEVNPSTEYVYRLRCPGYEWIEKTMTTGAFGSSITEELVPIIDNTGATIYNKSTDATQQTVLGEYNSTNGRLYINNTTGNLVEIDVTNAFIFWNKINHTAALIFSIDKPILLNTAKNGFNVKEDSQFKVYLKATSTASVSLNFLFKDTPSNVNSFHRFKSEILAHRIDIISEINNLTTPAEVLEAVTNQIPNKLQETALYQSIIAHSFAPSTAVTAEATTIPLTGFSDNLFTGHYIVVNRGGKVVQRRITSHKSDALTLNQEIGLPINISDTINILVRTDEVETTVAAVKTNLGVVNTGVKKASQFIPYTDDL